METAPLKSFATWARTALIREVTARVAAVLAPASKERVENESAVATLEQDITAAGGGDKGRDAVADKVAYTWFNRIIALRFMDANGYTGIGVVSPQSGHAVGQPEVLADAKRGTIDSAVVTSARAIETITALLDGARRSDDPQGEAYALLLTEYCRYWNRAMPFMFERAGDYTELLIPANLLADDSVLARVAAVLTEDVCADVEVIGWLYQFYIAERKLEVFTQFKQKLKASATEIPAATQLFTPHWIVRYLVENSIGRLWLLNRPTSRIAEQMDYYLEPADQETEFIKIRTPEDLKVIDPACGSGHMLTYAFDLLYAIYEEDGYAPADIPGLILSKNLFGTEIDPRAGALAAFALAMKARAKQRSYFTRSAAAGGLHPQISVVRPISFDDDELDYLATLSQGIADRQQSDAFWQSFRHADTIGALIHPPEQLVPSLKRLIEESVYSDGDLFAAGVHTRATMVLQQADFLVQKYSVVVANPPYMGGKNMDGLLSEWLRAHYPTGKQDLYGAFILRASRLAVRGGLVAMITGDSWMTIKTFDRMREWVLDHTTLHSVVHLRDTAYHSDIFGANVAFVLTTGPASRSLCTFIYLDPLDGQQKRQKFIAAAAGLDAAIVFVAAPSDFRAIPGSPIAYQLSEKTRAAFSEGVPLATIAQPRQGLATGDNNKFLRNWAEVSVSRLGLSETSRESAIASGRRWFPCLKGGPFRKWYGNTDLVVNWYRDGDEIRNFNDGGGRLRSRPQNMDYYFRPGATWSTVTSGAFSMRYAPPGFISETKGAVCYADEFTAKSVLALGNSPVMGSILAALSPTLDFHEGPVGRVPFIGEPSAETNLLVERAIQIAASDWHDQETSWGFLRNPIVEYSRSSSLQRSVEGLAEVRAERTRELQALEEQINERLIESYGLQDELSPVVPLERITLFSNIAFAYPGQAPSERAKRGQADAVRDLVSYAVGCHFGRFSIEKPGLILANQGDTLRDYLAVVSAPSFPPDQDNVIPIVDGDWFEDDIVARFRQFLRVTFGEEYFEENLRFVTESLGVKDMRDYFVKSFYKDHVQRYKKRPIYWLFSSPQGSFNALIYMHRYTPTTVSIVLNEYLREFRAKLDASRQHHERVALSSATPRENAAAEKEVDRLRKVLLELDEYEHDVLYPLATQQIAIDLDDGVKVNYPKFGAALKRIPGLETSDE
ncbi:BREX-1 system adenine-specific DNA-methyltransferase PglX [Mycetocola manganoxydans]|uniref:site-specific DNA-methyltransferase (adenine-specific) n=1 Tax=Mycetocola manganoxydans TaxID=699879 RepID=A0A3L6ZNE1_9MICO|nr:BREX-1 system adenine-specific DNA-methyltransferase PglX [Mycetocola manganoxydans]RLP69051.1 BREX-1 system adenine-specific DNA-methyltransferase PglX [Mycetocola manganoxydans]GHD51754.1 hypothetical protein GCM10008097_26940 [Mycetocola manganoxydans]